MDAQLVDPHMFDEALRDRYPDQLLQGPRIEDHDGALGAACNDAKTIIRDRDRPGTLLERLHGVQNGTITSIEHRQLALTRDHERTTTIGRPGCALALAWEASHPTLAAIDWIQAHGTTLA